MPKSSDDDRAAERIIEVNSRLHESAVNYLNLIMLAGYAGAFAIWGYTRDQLPPRAAIAVALCLSVSLTSFVLFEIYKMARMGKAIIAFHDLMSKRLPAKEFLAQVDKIEAERYETFRSTLLGIWRVSFSLSVITALIAVTILVYNFISNLIR